MDRPSYVRRLVSAVLEREERAAGIARLLHDDVGPTLSAIGLHLYGLKGDPAEINLIRGHLEKVMEQVRRASQQIYSDPVERSGLPLALEHVASRLRETQGVQVRLFIKAEKRYPVPVCSAALRIVELALDNVVRHSGARQAEIRLSATEKKMTLTVSDAGAGFDWDTVHDAPPGIGLILMEAYAQKESLHLRVTSTPRQGTIVKIQTT